MKLNLSRKKWDLIIKALSQMEYTEEDYEKESGECDADKAEILAEEIDIEYCKNYK